MHNKILTLIESVRTSFWFIPSTMVLVATVVAKLLLTFDSYHQGSADFPPFLSFLAQLYQGSPESIRSVLTVIAGSMMTVTSIAFSITVVALSLASSQFGPRLIRHFMADKGTQSVLGVFVSIFIYCVLVLQATKEQQEQVFVPGLSAYFAVFLAFVGVSVLIYFIHHVAQAIQADNVVNDVYCGLLNNVEQWFPDAQQDSNPKNTEQQSESEPLAIPLSLAQQYQYSKTVKAIADGYLQAIDIQKLISTAQSNNVAIEVNCLAGDFVAANSNLFDLYYDNDTAQKYENTLRACLMLGSKRTPIQDPEFAIHQLVEIAVRALSPGINDPYTAITCVDKLSAFLCTIALRPLPSSQHVDCNGVLRVQTKPLTFSSLGEAAFNQIRQYGKDSIAVTIRLLDSLYRISCCCRTVEQVQFVARQTEMIKESSAQIFISTYDLHDINSRLEKVKSNVSQLSMDICPK